MQPGPAMTPDIAETIYSAWRVLNIILAVVAGALIAFKAGRMWAFLDVQSRFLYMGAFFTCLTIVWSLVEILVMGVPGGPRVVITTLPLIWLIIAGATPSAPARIRALEKMRADLVAAKKKSNKKS